MAAPQLGINRRFIACNLGEDTFLIVNPEITWRSEVIIELIIVCLSVE